jgi:hypothetical protein
MRYWLKFLAILKPAMILVLKDQAIILKWTALEKDYILTQG